ncbi:MAG: hypothetical protein RSB59_07295, partial [Clostridia bacterium]
NYTGNKTAYWQINSCEVTLESTATESTATAGNTYIYNRQHQGVNTITPQILLGNGRFGSLNFQTGENLATYFDVAYYRYCSGAEETAANGWIIDASGYGCRPIGANASGVYTFKGNVEVGGFPRAINAVNVYGGDNGVGNNGYKIVFKIKTADLGDKANNYKFTTGANDHAISDGIDTYQTGKTVDERSLSYTWNITQYDFTKYSTINYTGLASGYKPDGTYINNNFNWYTQGVNGAYGVDNAPNNGGTLFMMYNYDFSQDDTEFKKLLGNFTKTTYNNLGFLQFLGANLG